MRQPSASVAGAVCLYFRLSAAPAPLAFFVLCRCFFLLFILPSSARVLFSLSRPRAPVSIRPRVFSSRLMPRFGFPSPSLFLRAFLFVAIIAPRQSPPFRQRGRRGAGASPPVPISAFFFCLFDCAYFYVPLAHSLYFPFRDPTLKAVVSRPRLETARKAQGGRLAAAFAAFSSAAHLPPNAHPRPPPFKERKRREKPPRLFLLNNAQRGGN